MSPYLSNAALLAAQPPAPKKKGKAHTPSVEELYGDLERQGLCRIIRKKGRAPQIVWL